MIRIRNWETHFEKADSKKCRQMLWVAIPTKHDGLGFRKLVGRENGPAMYGAWVVMVAVAAKCPKRGTLATEAGELTPDDLALKTGIPSGLYRDTIRTALELGWIEEVMTPSGRHPDSIRTSSRLQDKTDRQDKTDKTPHPDAIRMPFSSNAFVAAWASWEQHRLEKKHRLTPSTKAAQLRKMEKWGEAAAIAAIERSIEKGWTGLFSADAENVSSQNAQNEIPWLPATDEDRKRLAEGSDDA